MIAQHSEKERLQEILFHYSNCITAMDEVKTFIVYKKDIQAINKLKDIKSDLTKMGNWLQEMESELEEI